MHGGDRAGAGGVWASGTVVTAHAYGGARDETTHSGPCRDERAGPRGEAGGFASCRQTRRFAGGLAGQLTCRAAKPEPRRGGQADLQ